MQQLDLKAESSVVNLDEWLASYAGAKYAGKSQQDQH